MPYFGQDLLIKAQEKGSIDKSEVHSSIEEESTCFRELKGIDFVMKQHKLDALVAPTGGPPWPTDLVNGDRFRRWIFFGIRSRGLSAHNSACGLRVWICQCGISFFGTAWSEPKLIKIAYAFEQETKPVNLQKFLTNRAGLS